MIECNGPCNTLQFISYYKSENPVMSPDLKQLFEKIEKEQKDTITYMCALENPTGLMWSTVKENANAK